MPIVSWTKEVSTQADGSSHVVYSMVESPDGRVFTNSFYAPVGLNIDALIEQRVAEQNEWLAEAEFSEIVGV